MGDLAQYNDGTNALALVAGEPDSPSGDGDLNDVLRRLEWISVEGAQLSIIAEAWGIASEHIHALNIVRSNARDLKLAWASVQRRAADQLLFDWVWTTTA